MFGGGILKQLVDKMRIVFPPPLLYLILKSTVLSWICVWLFVDASYVFCGRRGWVGCVDNTW